MSVDFCEVLEDGRIEVAKELIASAASGPGSTLSHDPNFERDIQRLADWLSQKPCVAEVSVRDGVLKTEPPQKVICFTASVKGKTQAITLRLQLGRHLQIHALEV
jgi:hypothetical protein